MYIYTTGFVCCVIMNEFILYVVGHNAEIGLVLGKNVCLKDP